MGGDDLSPDAQTGLPGSDAGDIVEDPGILDPGGGGDDDSGD